MRPCHTRSRLPFIALPFIALPFALALASPPAPMLLPYCSQGERLRAAPHLIQKGDEIWRLKPPLREHGHDWVSGLYAHSKGGAGLADMPLRLRVLPEDLIVILPDGGQISAKRCP